MERQQRGEEIPQRLYHSCWHNPPKPEDFFSWERRKGKPHPRPERRRISQGISAWRTLMRAREAAKSSGVQGSWIAQIDRAKVRGVKCEQTGDPDHYTKWADPQAFVDSEPIMHPVSEDVKYHA